MDGYQVESHAHVAKVGPNKEDLVGARVLGYCDGRQGTLGRYVKNLHLKKENLSFQWSDFANLWSFL